MALSADSAGQAGALAGGADLQAAITANGADSTVVGELQLLVNDVSGSVAAPRQAIFSRTLRDDAFAPFVTSLLPPQLPLATDLASLGDRRVILLSPLPAATSSGLAASRQAPRDCALLELVDAGDPGQVATGAAATSGLSGPARLLPERWPRRGESAVRFVRHRDGQVRHLAPDGVHQLYRLAQARFNPRAEATLTARLDAGDSGTVWDCLYLDACLPPGCRIQVSARAVDDWAERGDSYEPQPEPVWSPLASELPFAPSLARRHSVATSGSNAAPRPGRDGLFEILLQRSTGTVRELRGRYLSLRFTLSGDGRHTPAIFAARVWFPRFSWQTQYLPEHFHQQQPIDDVPPGQVVPANGADLRERLFASFEAVLTPIEDRIAASEALLYPESVPSALLPHLAGLLGQTLRPHWPEPRQRRWLAQLGELQVHKGSYAGLCQALDIVTEGAVRRGQVVPVELFRLRRTMATVLGISMDDAAHPLTLGTGQSGNSLVGDTLILSDEQSLEVLALFAPELARAGVEAAAVRQFFDEHARRLTVLLHGDARALRGLVEQALPELVPATVQWQVVSSDNAFVPGLSPLLQIDTFLETTPAPGPVRLDRSRLGMTDLIRNPVALSPEDARAIAPDALPATRSVTRGDWA
jgi:phage tail-like protein